MAASIKKYNLAVRINSWKIQGRNQTTLLSLCQATPTVIQMLEDHYSTVRHMEGALTLDQLGYCDWGVGASRIPEGITNAPPIWKIIMDVKAEAIEEFAWNLARLLCLWRTRMSHCAHCMPRLTASSCSPRCVEPFWTSLARSGIPAHTRNSRSSRK
jgi:hypothetical protein